MESPYLEGPFAPVSTERSGPLSLLEGEVPRDLHGTYVRNGPNPRFATLGRHHWFDGDGMLHAVRFGEGAARYQRRWIRTAAFQEETMEERGLYRGLLESVRENPAGAHKDTGNTDILAFGSELLALHYMGGRAWRVDADSLETLGPLALPDRLSAHAKVDPETGELLFFDYRPTPPFLRLGVLREGSLSLRDVGAEVALEEAVFPHDMAFTRRFAILMAPPATLSAKHAAAGRWGVIEDPEAPFRFVLVPRDGSAARVFEASNCYLYHVCDAWEEQGAVVLVGFRCPRLFPASDPSEGAYG
ncbi:MAG: carotenoid oxygenase family protein, partial [Myxococcota bacterium]